MALRMASPWKHPTTGIYYIRVRTPASLMRRVRGQTVILPTGEGTATVKITDWVKASLRTRDPRVAKERFIKAEGALQAYWEAVEKGPRKLTQKEAVALSGDVYRVWTGTFADNPNDPGLWQNVLDANEDAEHGDYGRGSLMISPRNKKTAAMEGRFGAIADVVLTRRGLHIDEESRTRLLREVMRAATQAARVNLRRAEGDYRRDPDAERFPEFEAPKPKSLGYTMTDILATWEKEALRLGRAPATVRSYQSVFRAFREFLGHDDAEAVTGEDLIRYKDKLFEDGVEAKTIKDRHLAALKSVFGYAVENKKLPANPASDVKVRVAKRREKRPKGFTDAEALTILGAALGYERTGRETTHLAAAKRWVPWLLAFTGARIADVTGLRRENFTLDDTNPRVRIHDGKTGKLRDIPLHPQLGEVGLFDFIRNAKPGPLFFDERTSKGQAAQSIAEKIGKWVRSLHIPDDVQPNHGWRHRFTTLARACGMDHEKREFILGHALPGLGDTYGDMAGLRREIEKLPRYDVD